jgi:hypothetical protein
MIAYVDRFCISRDEQPIGAATEFWLTICQEAYRLQRFSQPVTTEPSGLEFGAQIGPPAPPLCTRATTAAQDETNAH